MKNHRLASWLQWIAQGILAIYAAFWALYGAGEVMALNFSGVAYFLPVILILGMMYLGWKRARIAGILLLVIGFLLSLRFYITLPYPEEKASIALVGGGPFILAGILLLLSSVLAGSSTPAQETGS